MFIFIFGLVSRLIVEQKVTLFPSGYEGFSILTNVHVCKISSSQIIWFYWQI